MQSGTRIDVLVVGGGAAGLASAVAAREQGADRVLVVEKASPTELGGNTRYSHAGFRFVHRGADEVRGFLPHLTPDEFARLSLPAYSESDFRDDLGASDRSDEPLGALVQGSNPAIRWMRSLGFEFEPNVHIVRDGKWHFEPGCPLQIRGGRAGGMRQLERWLELAAAGGIEIRFACPVTALHGSDEAVEATTCHPLGDRPVRIEADNVILASGGFQANADLRRRHLKLEKGVVRGSRHDTGEVLEMALGIGAAPSGAWEDAAVSPVAASAPPVEAVNLYNRYRYAYGVTVNREGHRFIDEGAGSLSATYGRVGWAILRQPGGIAFQIFDDRAASILLEDTGYADAPHITAATWPELAERAGIIEAGLVRTMGEYNAACTSSARFDPTRIDGRATVGIDPPKSNWAMPIVDPPFHCYPVTGGLTFTYGGLAVDASGRVLSRAGASIRGLYATGDIMGLFTLAYPAMAGQTRNVVFARTIGETINEDRKR